jgi:proton-dependent oligopeptide transporter, POT family
MKEDYSCNLIEGLPLQAEIAINDTQISSTGLSKPFWVIWGIELWERFGFYGVQAILALYFVKQLGYTESQSFYVFGSFSAFVYGFVWIGGWIGDNYLGAKRTLMLGTVILTLSYVGLALSSHTTIFYALSGIIVGNTLFKANSGSLIAKLYAKGDSALDSAMTLYYMAVNIGSMLSMAVTPIIAQVYGWSSAFWVCAVGLGLGLANYIFYRRALSSIGTEAGQQKLNIKRLLIILVGAAFLFFTMANLLNHTTICDWIVYTVVTGAFCYYLKICFSLKGIARTRMLVAFILILQGVLFFVLYNQMPTSLTFFAAHNINNHLMGLSVPPAEYQVLNSIVIIIMSPILAVMYRHVSATHTTKFCIGMTLCASGFLVLALPQYTALNGLASPLWMVLTYFLQSTGELLISGLGLAMVAELCPDNMTGFVMGIWFLTSMLAGPLGAWVGVLTAPPAGTSHFSRLASMHLYSHVFLEIGVVTGLVALAMWFSRPLLNRVLKGEA